MDGLLNAVNREYRLAATEIKPFHSVWRVLTPKGVFLLKQMHCSPERLVWLHEQTEQLIKAGFESLVPFLTTRGGNAYFQLQGRQFVVSLWQSGSNPSFEHLNPIKKTAATWGRLHRVAKALQPTKPDWEVHPLQDLEAKTAFLASTLKQLRSGKTLNRIDRAIAHWGEYYLTQAQTCLADLESLQYDHWVRHTSEYGFCHNDPAPRNIIIQEQKWFVIDYELSGTGLFLHELALLIRRVLTANQWNLQLIAPLVESYQTQRNATDTELAFLPGILCFPHAFWRLCRQRFAEALDWTEKHYQSRLWQIIQEETHRSKMFRYWYGERVNPDDKMNGGFQ